MNTVTLSNGKTYRKTSANIYEVKTIRVHAETGLAVWARVTSEKITAELETILAIETVEAVEVVEPVQVEAFEITIKGSVGVKNPFHAGDVVYVGAIEGMTAIVTTMPKVGDVVKATDWRGNEENVKIRQILNEFPQRPEHLEKAMAEYHEELFSGFFNSREKPTPERKRELEDMTHDQIYVVFGSGVEIIRTVETVVTTTTTTTTAITTVNPVQTDYDNLVKTVEESTHLMKIRLFCEVTGQSKEMAELMLTRADGFLLGAIKLFNGGN